MLNNMRTFYKRFSAAFYQPRTELEKCLCGSASPAADNVYFRNDRHHHRRHSRFRFSLPGAEKNTRTAPTSRKSDRRQSKLIYRPRSNNFDVPHVPYAVHRFSPEPDFSQAKRGQAGESSSEPDCLITTRNTEEREPVAVVGILFPTWIRFLSSDTRFTSHEHETRETVHVRVSSVLDGDLLLLGTMLTSNWNSREKLRSRDKVGISNGIYRGIGSNFLRLLFLSDFLFDLLHWEMDTIARKCVVRIIYDPIVFFYR